MSKLITTLPDAIRPQVDNQAYSFTAPNSLVDGCTDAMKAAATDPGTIGIGAAIDTGAAIKAGANNPVGAAATALGGEAVGACAYGVINTAVENCTATRGVVEDPAHNTPVEPLGNTNTNH